MKRRDSLAGGRVRRLYGVFMEDGGFSWQNRMKVLSAIVQPSLSYGMELCTLGAYSARDTTYLIEEV